ncbi:hypothetical protein FQZ97_849490 [compost metagenome]
MFGPKANSEGPKNWEPEMAVPVGEALVTNCFTPCASNSAKNAGLNGVGSGVPVPDIPMLSWPA